MVSAGVLHMSVQVSRGEVLKEEGSGSLFQMRLKPFLGYSERNWAFKPCLVLCYSVTLFDSKVCTLNRYATGIRTRLIYGFSVAVEHCLLVILVTLIYDNNNPSVQFSCSVISDSLQPHESQHIRPPCPLPTPGVNSNSRPSSRWCHPAILSPVVLFSSCSQSLPASESFPMSQLFTWGGQITGVSALASVPPMNTQGWSPLGWTGWISLQSKGLSKVFSNTTVQKHQFFGAQLSSQSNSHIHTWPLEKP